MKTKSIRAILPLFLSLTVTVLLMACGSPPTTSPQSRSSSTTVHVLSDGSGDYATLETAIESIAPESTIILDEGTFHLEEALEIDKPLTLEGAGSNKTIVSGEGAVASFRYTGSGLLTIRDITFSRVGDFAASVMAVLGGEVNFSNCRFTGGASNEDNSSGGVGLAFTNDSTGVVQNCEFDENSSFGIAVFGQADPELISNNIHDNGQAGIYISIKEAGGLVERNDLRNNGLAGRGSGTDINVIGGFSPTLASNTCSREGPTGFSSEDWSGIVIISTSGNISEATSVEGNGCAILRCDATSGMLSMTCKN